jgi:hypothetical protein
MDEIREEVKKDIKSLLNKLEEVGPHCMNLDLKEKDVTRLFFLILSNNQ